MRTEAIALFFAIARVFGAVGPILFRGAHRAGNHPSLLFIGYAIGGGIMIDGGVVELLLGVAAERKELERVARPVTPSPPLRSRGRSVPRAHYSPSSKSAGHASTAA
jgi:hypothetical protein